MLLVWRQERRRSSKIVFNSAVDLWAVGVVVYQLLCGALPFGLGDPSEDFEETGDRIVSRNRHATAT